MNAAPFSGAAGERNEWVHLRPLSLDSTYEAAIIRKGMKKDAVSTHRRVGPRLT